MSVSTIRSVCAGLLASAAGQDHVLAVDAATGKELWRVPLGASPPKLELGAASTPATDGRRVSVPRVIEASPAGYKEKARREVFNPGALSDTPPTIAGRRLYLYSMEEMVALEVEK
jgi:outer membrane protein assembly factor BamB